MFRHVLSSGRNNRILRRFAVAASLVLGTSAAADAAVFQWDGGGANTNWSTAGNWVGSAPSSNDQNDLEFGSVALVSPFQTTANNNIASDFALNSVTFNGTANASFIVSGSQIEYKKDGSTQPTITQNSNLAQAISSGIKVGGDQLTLGGNDTGLVTLSSAISGGKPLIKSGTSTFLLTAASSDMNTTTINGGTLIVGHANALDTDQTITVNSGGTLAVNSSVIFTRPLTLNSGATLAGKGTYTPGGTLTIATGRTVAPGINDIGTFTIGNSTTFAAGSILAISVGAGATNNDRLNVTGTLNTGAANTLALNMTGADQGKYTIASATTLTIGSNTAANGGFGAVTGLDAAYRLNADTAADVIELIHKATIAIDISGPAQMITGGSVAFSGHVANIAPTLSDALTYTLGGSAGVSGLPGGTLNRTAGDANAAAGALYNGNFTSATLGANLVTVTATGTVAGTVANSPQAANFSIDVLEHSDAAFTNVAGAYDSFLLSGGGDNLAIDFGIVTVGDGGGSLVASFDLLAQIVDALYTAGLDLDSVAGVGDTAELALAGLSSFANKTAGDDEAYTVTLDTTTAGVFAVTYTFKLSDQNLAGATAPESEVLTLTVTGEVVAAVPAPGSLAVIAVAMAGGLVRRRRNAGR